MHSHRKGNAFLTFFLNLLPRFDDSIPAYQTDNFSFYWIVVSPVDWDWFTPSCLDCLTSSSALNTDSYSYKRLYLNWLVSNDDQRREGNARLKSKTGKGIRREFSSAKLSKKRNRKVHNKLISFRPGTTFFSLSASSKSEGDLFVSVCHYCLNEYLHFG